jgi:hypothetical protein
MMRDQKRLPNLVKAFIGSYTGWLLGWQSPCKEDVGQSFPTGAPSIEQTFYIAHGSLALLHLKKRQ